MLTDDKIRGGDNRSLRDNVNTRDQNRAGIVLVIIALLGLWSVYALGAQHQHAGQLDESNPHGAHSPLGTGSPQLGAKHVGTSQAVEKAVGVIERPGTVGKPQTWAKQNVGNTPAEIPSGVGRSASDTMPNAGSATNANPPASAGGH